MCVQSGDRLRDYVKTSDGRLLLQLVRELLSCFELKFTLSVFDQEIGGCGDAVAARSREDLVEILGLRELLSKRESPVLSEILRLSKVSVLKSETPTPTAGQSTEDEDESSAALSSIDSNVGLPMSSNNNGGGRLTTGEKDAVTKSNSTSKGPNITSSPDSREGLSLTPSKSFILHASPRKCNNLMFLTFQGSKPSSSLGDLPSLSKPQTSSSSLLGNLPALGGGGGNSQGGRRTLAPLKKPPPPAATAVQQIPSAPAPAASKPPPPAAQPAPPKPGPTPPAEAEEASLSEVIDEELDFEDSTSTENGGRADKEEKNSVSDHTRDETASENESLRVDYAEAI